MEASPENRPAIPGATPDEPLRAAFRELQGPRLHGFALLLTLGDQAMAARLAGDALAAGANRAAELSHPERAAAWLRHRVVREASRRARGVAPRLAARRSVLDELGVDAASFAGLSALDLRERAALIATTVERLDVRDVAAIVGVDGTRLERLIRRARRRATTAGATVLAGRPIDDGPLATRIRAIAAETLA